MTPSPFLPQQRFSTAFPAAPAAGRVAAFGSAYYWPGDWFSVGVPTAGS
ncbi:hypothetical protein [Halomonas borealis]|nr:hypothetical protein [Halomonas borealis]